MNVSSVRHAVVIGTGLVGTSIALALRNAGVHVGLHDRDDDAVAMAVELGAGVAAGPEDPPADVVVIATPPSTVVGVLCEAQACGLGAVYTDVASTKERIVADVERAGADLASYVPGHPIAGGELSGPTGARADLFVGRPWALCPSQATSLAAVLGVIELVKACRAVPKTLPPDAHDRVLALVSHVPHVVSAVLAARFADADAGTLSWVGKGLRDTTRIAAGDPDLWCDILRHNAPAVAEELESVLLDMADAVRALRMTTGTGPPRAAGLVELLAKGNQGRDNIVSPQEHRRAA